MIELLIQAGISIIGAIRDGIEAGKIKPEDIEGLMAQADDLKAKREAAVAQWESLAPEDD